MTMVRSMPSRPRASTVIVASLVALWLGAAALLAPVSDEQLRPPDFVPEPVALALSKPCPATAAVGLADTPGVLNISTVRDFKDPTAVLVSDDGSMIAASRRGLVVEWSATSGLSTVLDLSERTSTTGDQGLLELAWLQDALLVLRTDETGATVLTSHRRIGEGSFDAGTELLEVAQPDPRHNGGGLAVSAAGEVFVGVGDGGLQGDPHGNAADPSSLLGKVLRGKVDWGRASLVPTDGAGSLVWAVGVRNPHRIWLSADDAQVWVADVGENCREEINRLAIDQAHYDLGWNAREGDVGFAEDPSRIALTDPLASYDHERGRCAVIGGAPAPAALHPSTNGSASIVADLCTGELFIVDDDGLRWLPAQADSPVDISPDERGDILISQADGQIRRLHI